ncbi:uncharacterized protein LOC104895438 isoform X2 [Beta vulgaris subsp. vulgaris]|uniref:uncharacterized protein LOC104895438 isoform X2 n=1 Tax=Beta vulgaris subsp. vulgaris TaxID=3555 RepID=UPI00203747D7|nr:uncharacterized protein LOC104895438 isoform X2 [Beta vulgaris subsp. vulgaris]
MRVCQTCGSRGYSEALVVCSKCQSISEHTYCLDKLEETDDGQIRWTCEFCEPRVIQLSDSTNVVSDTETIESFKELQDDAEKPHCSSMSVEAQTVRDSGTGPSTNESSFNQDLEKNHNLHLPCEYSEATRIEASNSGSPETSSILEDDFYNTVEPLPNPIWMGNFQLYGEYNYTVHGMVAHIANVASKEASEVASSLPMPLCVEVVPKISIWPIKFKEMEPTTDNIAVYFFPEDYRITAEILSMGSIQEEENLASKSK